MAARPAFKVVEKDGTEEETRHGDGNDGGGFGVGSLVALKSGGTTMTVIGLDADTGWVLCAWFDDADTFNSVPIPAEALQSMDAE